MTTFSDQGDADTGIDWRCTRCRQTSNHLSPVEGGRLCDACIIGDVEPFAWLATQAMATARRHPNGHGFAMVSLGRDGRCIRGASTEHVAIALAVHVVDGKVGAGVSRWVKSGRLSAGHVGMPCTSEEYAGIADRIRPMLAELWTINDGNKIPCCKCGKMMERAEVAGRHFVGSFCDEDWSDYKQQNPGRCGMCGKPDWACVC